MSVYLSSLGRVSEKKIFLNSFNTLYFFARISVSLWYYTTSTGTLLAICEKKGKNNDRTDPNTANPNTSRMSNDPFDLSDLFSREGDALTYIVLYCL